MIIKYNNNVKVIFGNTVSEIENRVNDLDSDFISLGDINFSNENNCFYQYVIEKESPLILKVVRLDKDAIIPDYAYSGDSGLDLYSPEERLIEPFKSITIGVGFAIQLPPGYEGQVRPKSSLSKMGIIIDFGTIDNGYTGEIVVGIKNFTNDIIKIEKGQKIGQLVIMKVEHVKIFEVEKLDETERGPNGFGSSGSFKNSLI